MSAKKTFTKLCLNNWGGIDHRILEFNEYVNLFSGKSGSGKSTVMDAIQVLLYGSLSPSFLNKAADDAKNRRSVLSYLRGEQKDGSANREGQDFYSLIAMEIYDSRLKSYTVVGIVFEVGRADTDIKRYQYFSHSGAFPENAYMRDGVYAFSTAEVSKLVEERKRMGKGNADVNRMYASNTAYQNALYNSILGYIDGTRFVTMEKSAIALKMTNGTSQFIRDYMFPASSAKTIEQISEQLGSYRDIREKVEDLHARIELLTAVRESGQELIKVQTDILHGNAFLRCMDIQELEAKLEVSEQKLEENHSNQEKLNRQLAQEQQKQQALNEELVKVLADLKSSDLGNKEEHLKDLKKQGELLAGYSRRWRQTIHGLASWEEDTIVNEYLSNTTLNLIASLREPEVSEESIRKLKDKLAEEKENLRQEYQDYNEQLREKQNELKEKQSFVEAMRSGQKPYREDVRKARMMLENKLSDIYGHKVPVRVFADLFDITDEEWKNAVEGRMGKLKLSLITEPRYARDAAQQFRRMKQFENVDLINSAAIEADQPKARPNSLYEVVETDLDWVDACLKRYIGHIIMCDSVEELEKARDGVTKDCYSYSNYIYRHLRRDDYEKRACIGRKVSLAKLKEYEADIEQLSKERDEILVMTTGLGSAQEYEALKESVADYVELAQASGRLEELNQEILVLGREIEELREGKYKETEQRKKELEGLQDQLAGKLTELRAQLNELTRQEGSITRGIEDYQESLDEKKEGYVANPQIEAEVEEELRHVSGQTLRGRITKQIGDWRELEQKKDEQLKVARDFFNRKYPTMGFHGMEKSNQKYEELLDSYEKDYEPKYQAEFQKQCDLIYKSLRDNVIATIHGEIKEAMRHRNWVNRLLRNTNFSDSTYQIKIEAAHNENGQFYEMLMAPELDSKNLDNGGYDGQLSFGEDSFYQKYERQIELLTEKFMPPRLDDDEKTLERRRREQAQYADYRNYLSFSMYEQVLDEHGNLIRENQVDDMAGRDSGGEGQNPKYVALLTGFAMLYYKQSVNDSKINLVLLDEAFSKMDQERSEVCLKYARQMDLQLIVCVPDERLQSLIRNVDCVYGFRRHQNHISMMHIDKGKYLKLMEGEA